MAGQVGQQEIICFARAVIGETACGFDAGERQRRGFFSQCRWRIALIAVSSAFISGVI